MEEASADPALEADRDCPPLIGETTADVAILGGGYTGMWTAWFLKEREPALDVVLLEAQTCGSGPSGRNGGFCYGMWEDLPALAAHLGDADALRLCEAAHRSVDEIRDWCVRHDLDVWFRQAGHLTVATSPAQDGAWEHEIRECLIAEMKLGQATGYWVPPINDCHEVIKDALDKCRAPGEPGADVPSDGVAHDAGEPPDRGAAQ
jgi:glycine/D-amino acid oxidase-like deaminating enzyme